MGKTSLKNIENKSFPNKSRNKKLILWGFILVIIFLFFFGWLYFSPLFFEKAQEKALIKIPVEATRNQVRDSVAKYLGEDYANKVLRVSNLRGSDFSKRHGAYMIEENLSPVKAERILSHGAQHPLILTVNGFKTKDRLAERVGAKLDFTADSLLNLLNNNEEFKTYGLTAEQSLSLFLDDSYQVYWSSSPKELIEKMGKNYNKVWNEERKAKAAELGLTPAEVMIICSIVDEETNKADDKGKIGRLYINRLKKGMKLQADPTVKFALGDFSLRRIRSNHLQVESPYNTYKVTGLPPGPIKTTSVATIDSVLNSKPNNYVYMCAKDDFSGYHVFASNYSDHLVNAKNYQKALNKRGIK